MMDDLQATLFALSNALLWPCLVLLFLIAAFTLFAFGAFLREWIERRRGIANRIDAPLNEASNPSSGDTDTPRSGDPRALEIALDELLSKIESDMDRRIGRLVLCSKLGPMLGLAGTLIPLGPALRSLTRDDVESLSKNLMVAFATTVLGLAVSAVCLCISTVRRRWYAGDMDRLEDAARLRLEVRGGSGR